MLRKIASLISGNVVFVGSQWLVLVMLTKFVGLKAAGVYALSLAIVSPIYTLTNVGLRPVAATDVEGENDLADYLIISGLGNLVAAVASLTVGKLVFASTSVDLVVLSALMAAKTIESFSFVFYGFLQRRSQIEAVSRSLAMRGILGLVAFAGILVITGAYAYALYGIALAWLIVLWWGDYPRVRLLQVTSTREKSAGRRWIDVKRLFMTAYPLGILASFNVTSQQIPRYFIERQLSIEHLGIYAGIAQLALMGTTVVNAIGQTVIGKLAELYRHDLGSFVALQIKALGAAGIVGILGIALAWVVGAPLLEFLYSQEFTKFGDVFVLAMLWSAVMYLSALMGSGMSGMRLFKEQTYAGGLSLLVTLAASYVLIARFELNGAFYALIVAAICKLSLQIGIVLKNIGRR